MRNFSRGLRKTPLVSQAQHNVLSGAIRVTSRSKVPRRWSGTLPWIDHADADWLLILIRKLYGPGPIAMIDPSTRNFLAPQQSVGRGRLAQWDPTAGTVTTAGGQAFWTRTGTAQLRWVHPIWGRWPTSTGLVVSFRQYAGTGRTGLRFYDAAGVQISGADTAGSVHTATSPSGAQWVQPYLSATGSGTVPMPLSCLLYGSVAPEDFPVGEHCAAFAIGNPDEIVDALPRRTVALELLEQF
ncbi:hypothetical protein [Amycolatopsis antarctica]|nr:hypothetical protein [Amycolatopsis antarctica]